MKGLIPFLRNNARLLSFGFALTFFSSFGQTFLLSLYIPEIAPVIGFTSGKMGSLYAGATLGSAAILSWAGRFIDYIDLKKYSLLVVGGSVIALLILSQASHWILVLVGLLLLRLTGQGLMGHTSVTTMSRYFIEARGKAISIATLGFPLGEAALPLIVALSIGFSGWRLTLIFTAVLVAFALSALVLLLLQKVDTKPPLQKLKRKEQPRDGKMSYFLGKRAFWIIAPNVFLMGFVNTAVFFFQVSIGESKGWSTEWVAGSLAAFALASGLSMFTAGPLVDRFTAKKLFPFYFAPYIIGLVLFGSFTFPVIYPVALFLMGLSNGAGSTIKSALQAEIFGTTFLGSVRSLFTVLMVVSTALGPLIFGLFIDAGISYNLLLYASAGVILIAVMQSFRVLRL